MQAARRLRMGALLGLGLLGVILLPLAWIPAPGAPAATRMPPLRRAASDTPSQASLREAKWEWGQAQMVVKPEYEVFLERNPYLPPESEAWGRLHLLARDQNGHLRQASAAAEEAVSRAETPTEEYLARLWVAIIACDRGRHRVQLQQARRLVGLKPWNRVSWGALRRAARCNGLESQAQEADGALQALEEAPLIIPDVSPHRAATKQLPNAASD